MTVCLVLKGRNFIVAVNITLQLKVNAIITRSQKLDTLRNRTFTNTAEISSSSASVFLHNISEFAVANPSSLEQAVVRGTKINCLKILEVGNS